MSSQVKLWVMSEDDWRALNMCAEESQKWKICCSPNMTNREGVLCNVFDSPCVFYRVARWYISWITLCIRCNPLNICAHSRSTTKISGGFFLQSCECVALISSTRASVVWNGKIKAAFEPNLLQQKSYQKLGFNIIIYETRPNKPSEADLHVLNLWGHCVTTLET